MTIVTIEEKKKEKGRERENLFCLELQHSALPKGKINGTKTGIETVSISSLVY